MAINVKFSTGLEEDLLKLNSDKTYVHKIDNGHVYFATKVDDDGKVIGSIYYDVDGKRVSMGGGVAEIAKSDDMGNVIADTYVTRISSEGEKYASTDGVTITTYNARNAVLNTILLPTAGPNRAGVLTTGAQTITGNKTFDGKIIFPNMDPTLSTFNRGIYWTVGDNDGARIATGAGSANAGFLEIAVKDDGNEPIYVRQYTGDFATIVRTLTLLDASGDTILPGSLLPTVKDSKDLGSETYRWNNVHAKNIQADTLSGHLTGSLTGNVTGNVTGHASLDLPLAGGTMTGDITFATIATWPTASGETYPIKSKGLKWAGSSDSAAIYYQVDGSDSGHLYLDTGDDAGASVKFSNKGAAHTVMTGDGKFHPVTNNSGSIGTASNKFAAIYATNFYGIIERAYADESGNNIKASYAASLQNHAHDGDGWSFRLLNKNGGALTPALTIPGATDSLAGLITTGEQAFAGNKTFSGRIHFSNTTDAAKSSDSGVITIGNKSGEHMLLDQNEIMVKGNATTSSVLHLQAEGGSIETGGSFIPKGNKTLDLGTSSNSWKNVYIGNIVADTLSGHLTGSLTGNVTGNATSATKLQTARNIILGNDLQGSVSFDGTKDVTFSASSYNANISGGNTQNYPWHRIATIAAITGDYVDKDAVIAIRHAYNGGGWGIAKISVRVNQASAGATAQCTLTWIIRWNIAEDALQAGFRNTAKDTYADVFYKCGTWPRAKVYQLQGDRIWTLVSSNEANDTTSTDKKGSTECYATIAAAGTALGRTYTSTVVATDEGIVNRAYTDESGNNIKASYLAAIQQVTSDKDTFTFRGYNKNNGAMNNLITIPAATASDASNANWKAGLVTSQAQTWAGHKTFKNDITIQHATVDTMTNTSANPFLKFLNSDGSQGAMLMFTDYDSYRAPGGLKLLGIGSVPAWFEVEGDLIVGGATTLNGNLTLKGNLLPSADNTYTLGSNDYKWKEMHATTGYINSTLYVNRSANGASGGIGLYSTSAPTDYGIAMRNNLGQHGYATDGWNTYFSMVGGAARGWIFRNGGTAIASINGQGKMTLDHSLQSPSVGKQNYIAYPKDGVYVTSANEHKGYLKITLPQSWTSTMMRFKVSVYNYSTGTSVEYLIGGYNYSGGSTWEHQAFAQCIGKWEHPSLSNLTVRFGHDGTKCAIYIGESSTVWNYPQVVISDIVVGYSNYEHSKWCEGWVPSFTTTLGTITKTISNTNIAYRAYHADRATADESGSNIKANYLARIRQVTSDKDTFTFRGVNKNGADMNDLITVPSATAAGDDTTTWRAGLVTSQAQTWAGTKTFKGDIHISHAASATMDRTTTNPRVIFSENGTQPVGLVYTDYDGYRSPAGLKVMNMSDNGLAWFEVEGALIVGSTSTLNGNVTVKGDIMPQADNTYVIGDLNTKWKDIYSTSAHVYNTLYVNTSTTGNVGGIALHGTVDPTTYGIAMRSDLGAHGYATDTWNTYFSMANGATRGWVFRNGGTNVASINGQGYAQLNKLCLNRVGGAANGRIGWYSKDFYTWYDYMSNSDAGAAPTGGKPSQMGSVTSWARRSLIENVANYGWVWESTANAAASSTSAQPTPRMALASDTGRLYLSNDLMIMMGDTDKFVHYLYANGAGATNYVGASWRAGVLGSGSANTNYYVIQSGTSSTANTTWENAVRIGQNNYDFTVGTTTKGGIGIANTNSATGNGISLYNGAVAGDGTAKSGKPTYGLFFGGTGTFGKHGGVQGDWATYFTMDTTANRGWVFLNGDTAIASISNSGITKLGDGSGATASSAGSDTGALRVVGGISTTKNSYFNEKITFPENKVSLEFSSRDTWKTGFFYDTSGHEALVLAMQNPRTSFMIVDSVDPNAWTNGTWSTKTPVIQAKKGALYINQLFNGDPAYNLYVNGSTYMETSLDVMGIAKFKQGSTATGINTGAVQITGGLSATGKSWFDNEVVIGQIRGKAVGSQAAEFIHMYDRVHIGSPSGWGSYSAPAYGLSTYGGAWFAVNQGNVGIGTQTPTANVRLHVQGGGGLAVIDDAANNSYDALGYFRHFSNNDWGIKIDKNNSYDYGLFINTAHAATHALEVNGASRFTNTLRIGNGSNAFDGNYCEGIRIRANDGQWTTIIMGATGETGTNENAWSIHRKSDNNFCISRNSSDGANGLVMTATGMGLGTTAPAARLHVVGNTQIKGHTTVWTTDSATSPGAAALEIREVNQNGSGGTHSAAYAPRLGFHWGNRYWGQIAMYDSAFRFYNSDLSGYMPIYASSVNASSVNASSFSGTAKDVAVAAYRTTDGAANYILVKINSAQTHWMTAFTVRVYQGYNHYDVTFSGYQYGTNYWYSPQATLSSSTITNVTVYFGYNSQTEMWVALPGSSYTGAKVINVVNGYQPLDITTAFSITRESSLPGTHQATVTAYRPWIRGESVTNAVWNDYAECREADTKEPGYVLVEKGDDTLTRATKRLQAFAGIVSDTWGFSQGETDKAKTNIAVAGRVLAYTYQPRERYKPGDCVCAAPGGLVDIMTREEVIKYPDRIVGTVSYVPDYEEWGGGEKTDRDPVKVNGRIWIKIK